MYAVWSCRCSTNERPRFKHVRCHATWATRFQEGQYLVVCVQSQTNIVFKSRCVYYRIQRWIPQWIHSDKESDDGFKARRIIISEINTRRHLHLHNPASWSSGTKQSWSKSSKTKAALSELFWSPDWANSSDEKKHITGKNSLWVIHERWFGTTVRNGEWRHWHEWQGQLARCAGP